jgi:hypothetical protein
MASTAPPNKMEFDDRDNINGMQTLFIQPTISLEMPVSSQGHYGFQFSGC